jgi:hypothetical protein
VWLAFLHLGSHVLGCADIGVTDMIWHDHVSRPEIAEFELPGFGDKYIFGFDISMQDGLWKRVEILDGLYDIEDVFFD